MAGGKKKSAANKLAKMSDEERARYLQHKADMEEEAKRRKEQLIATFMKKKIKKEDAFSRLNLAKINQNWHQILRRAKCQEMRENVGHLKVWIERLLDYKNRTISKLMEELEEAEEQYSNNFQCHSTHVDDIIEKQHDYIEKLQKEYEEDLLDLLEITATENEFIMTNAQTGHDHLKTILYRQETTGARSIREQFDGYMEQYYETEHNLKAKLARIRSSREATISALWRQIATMVRLYVQQTDSRRMHLAELRKLDAESAVEIADNEERIRREEELIIQLQKDHENMSLERENIIKILEIRLGDLNKDFLKIKKTLQRELQTDEKKLNTLTDYATSSVLHLEGLAKKGEHIRNLVITCRKYETEREKVAKWLPKFHMITKYDGDEVDVQESVQTISGETKTLPILQLSEGAVPRKKSSGRPKTAITGSAHSATTATPESRRITTIKQITIQTKKSKNGESSSSSSSCSESVSGEPPKDIVERCCESLKNLENFWFVVNKVEIDYMEIKEEKRLLEKENKQLRGMIRAVLEAAALSQTVPNSGVSTRLPSRRRSVQSAPLRRVVLG